METSSATRLRRLPLVAGISFPMAVLREHAATLTLVGIVALATVLRIVGLGTESLWGDEIDTVLTARRPWLDILTEPTGNKQPLYFLLMRGWTLAMGESEFAVRFPSAVFGVGTVIATFVLARRLANEWIGVGAAFLVAVSPVMIWYSQEVRMYTMTAFLLVVSTYFLIRYLEERRNRWILAYAGSAFLGLYTHYYFAPFVAGHALVGLWWLWRTGPRSDAPKWLAALLFVSLSSLSRINVVLHDLSRVETTAFTDSPSRVLLDIIEAVGLGALHSGGWLPIVIALWASIGVAAIVTLWQREKTGLLLPVCLIPAALLVAGAVLFDLAIVLRYFIPTIPLWYILVARGAALPLSWRPLTHPLVTRTFVVALMAVAAATALVWSLVSWDQQLAVANKQQWREAAVFVENEVSPSDDIYVYPSRVWRHLGFYLEQPGILTVRPKGTPTCDEGRRVWLVGMRRSGVEEAVERLKQSCVPVTFERFVGGIGVFLFDASGPGKPLTQCQGLDPTIAGTTGDDVLLGTAGPDVIHGLGGNDTITGLGGDDVICGGEGNDKLNGSDGADSLDGGAGNDKLNGGEGSDTLDGVGGDDTLNGGLGDDVLIGDVGNDRLNGGDGSDQMNGGGGADTLNGGDGDDVLTGDIGDDELNGGPGSDQMAGGEGNDLLNGGPGDDEVNGGDGDDMVNGSQDADEVRGNDGQDELKGGQGDDDLDGGLGTDTCDGGPGANTLVNCEG